MSKGMTQASHGGPSAAFSVRLNAMANIPKTPTNYAQFPVCFRFVPCLFPFVPKALGIVLAYGIWHATVRANGRWHTTVSRPIR
jgi:hypothetical protein